MENKVFAEFQSEQFYYGKQVIYGVWNKSKSAMEDINNQNSMRAPVA